jgi:hypothetical protein
MIHDKKYLAQVAQAFLKTSGLTLGFQAACTQFARFGSDEEQVHCRVCEQDVERDEFNSSTDECNYCHDAGDPGECGCERCIDKLSAAADALYDRMREGE